MGVLHRLSALLQAESILPADALSDPADGATEVLGALAASGPRVHGREDEYSLLVETIREGYLQHYGTGRVVRPADRDLALLAGDALYALGLSQLAALGDLRGIRVLADVISSCAQAHAEGRPADADDIWARGAASIGDGVPDYPAFPAVAPEVPR